MATGSAASTSAASIGCLPVSGDVGEGGDQMEVDVEVEAPRLQARPWGMFYIPTEIRMNLHIIEH